MYAICTYEGRTMSLACAVCCMLTLQLPAQMAAINVEKSSAQPETGWVPSTMFANSSSSSSAAWYLPRPDNASGATAKAKLPTGRAFHDNRIDGSGFDYGEYADRGDDYKAIPFVGNDPPTANPAVTHFHTVLKPASDASSSFASSPSSGLTLSNLQPFSQSYPYAHSSAGYHYPVPQYLPPASLPASQYLPPIQNIETFDHEHHFRPTSNENATGGHQLQTNTKSQLIVQPGKCSNSIEVGRVRDVEVKTVLKYGADAQKGVCVLMLYAANELNKLAISLQAVQGTTNVIPTGTWLETNVKMYAVQAGDIQPIFTKSNFGANSPALVLTRSNIVILSFYIDRPIDFFLDISTYQSLTC